MQIKTLNILGFSEATLTMVFDILETNNFFPEIKIINNIGYTPIKEYVNNKFNIEILDSLDLYEFFSCIISNTFSTFIHH